MPTRRAYVPERGDFVWLNFTPQAGHEQAGHRPAIVLSRRLYNERAGLMLCCPITNRAKGYPFEVATGSAGVSGVILADQLRSLDWKARQASFKARAEASVVDEVLARSRALLQR